ncbi:MAG: hypothetical protein HY720_15065, partial [Planctomycetes bacterium]|nr:hypothetical protein [Planctomycetota bacterium]
MPAFTQGTDRGRICAPREAFPGEPWFAATDHETERARFWLPTVDLPCVRSALDFHLTAEARFTILANGTLVSEDRHADGTKTAHWRLESPCPSYLTCFAVAEYVRTYAGKTVETDDFRRILEARSGRSLGRFFDEWFHTAG